jgi:hypothetical protein
VSTNRSIHGISSPPATSDWFSLRTSDLSPCVLMAIIGYTSKTSHKRNFRFAFLAHDAFYFLHNTAMCYVNIQV